MALETKEPLPEIIPVLEIEKWLPEIFPEGTSNRQYLVRKMAAKTLFVMLYVGAVEGRAQWMRPDQVTKMTDEQAACIDEHSRRLWARESIVPGRLTNISQRWYAANTREPIRDETLRQGLLAMGAAVEREDLPTTSATPRYAVAKKFAELLRNLSGNPANAGDLISEWQAAHLNAAALSRITLLRKGAVSGLKSKRIKITFPNGEARLMRPGPSTVISKGVVEEFAPRFLKEPGVIFLSESADKVVARDEELASAVGLKLDFDRNLPDLVLVDANPAKPRVVFVEVVATDGAINEMRKRELLTKAIEAGYAEETVCFVTAFLDRNQSAFRRLASEIAWGTFAWFLSEPDRILWFKEGKTAEKSGILD